MYIEPTAVEPLFREMEKRGEGRLLRDQESVGTEKGDAVGRAISVIPNEDDVSVSLDLADEVSIMLTHSDVSDELAMLLEWGETFDEEDTAILQAYLQDQEHLPPYRVIARLFVITVLDTDLFPLEKVGYGD